MFADYSYMAPGKTNIMSPVKSLFYQDKRASGLEDKLLGMKDFLQKLYHNFTHQGYGR
jgi:hypothetical protein